MDKILLKQNDRFTLASKSDDRGVYTVLNALEKVQNEEVISQWKLKPNKDTLV